MYRFNLYEISLWVNEISASNKKRRKMQKVGFTFWSAENNSESGKTCFFIERLLNFFQNMFKNIEEKWQKHSKKLKWKSVQFYPRIAH